MTKEMKNQREMKIKRMRDERKRNEHVRSKSSKSSVIKNRAIRQEKSQEINKEKKGGKKKKLTYDPMDLQIMENNTAFDISYDPLQFKKELEETEKQFEMMTMKNNPQKDKGRLEGQMRIHKGIEGNSLIEKRRLEAQMRIQKEREDMRYQRVEDQLPTYQKHLPRKLPGMIKNLDSSIHNSLSN